ncbi:hypothetical protein, partial, partial [Absidia glauca]
SEPEDALNGALLHLVEETSQRWSRLAVLVSNDHQNLAREAQDDDDQQTDDQEGGNNEDDRTTENMSLNSIPSTSGSTSTMGVSNLQIGTVPTTSPQPTIAISTYDNNLWSSKSNSRNGEDLRGRWAEVRTAP